MAPTPKTQALPVPATPARKSSPELGSPSKIPQYNKSTGRPIRKSAGVVKKIAGYVDSGILDEEDFEPLTSELSEIDSEDDMDQRGRTDKTKKKRKRSLSPPSPRLDPIIYNQEVETLTDDETSGTFHHHTPKKPPVTLQFNVPLGFHGPLFVKLDSALLKDNEEGTRHDMKQIHKKKARTGSPAPQEASLAVQTKGFADIPPELRNTIYRHVFIRDNHVLRIPQYPMSGGLSRSSQFLRACKLVHDEGCSILYGENEFAFDRHAATRSPFWDPKPKEIGYQDFLHFLKMIGPENLQYIRNIKIDFEDALPKFTPDLTTESRRYINDEYLLNCLRILRDTKLRKISMNFYGRRQLVKSDVKFLGYLEQIKVDEAVKLGMSWPYPTKFANWVWNDVKEVMVRKKKLYEKK
ncbi:hypothetical protein EK21DRAFT_63979 [Setomelanomma holmii]|uniref:Uncharacterized protein n=1 Tax=Setomelanomma holmii TaxID=210430 RepID=A0A9P4HBC4_9PLEO|nr:hypothetical protein EK21DRAFT_63979 [Setomelanomma holmii]